jgi:hypothetical protein
MNSNTALTPVTSGPLANYSLIQDAEAALELLAANLGHGGLSPSMITKIKFPSGGGTTWEIPDVTAPGGIDSQRAIEGVILHWHQTRAYFQTREDKKPLCRSNDGQFGEGTPGGNCHECRLNQWGSDGKGKACKEKIAIYIVRPCDILPIRVSIPSTSLRAWQQFGFALFQKRRHFSSVVTRLTLKAVTDKKDPYAVAQFEVAHLMDEVEAARTREEHARFLQNLASYAAPDDEFDDAPATRRSSSVPPPEPPDNYYTEPLVSAPVTSAPPPEPPHIETPSSAPSLPLHASDAEKRRCEGYRESARQLFRFLKDQSQNPEPAKGTDSWGPAEWAGYLAGLHGQTVRLIQGDAERLLESKGQAIFSDVDHERLKALPTAEVGELLNVAKLIEDKTGIPF